MKRDLVSDIKDMLFWYARENRIIFLPIHAFFLSIWIILCKLLFKRRIVNRNKKVVAFTSLYFNGNARAVFEYITEKFEGAYTCFWIARNMTTYKHLRKLKKPVVYLYFPFIALNLVTNTSALVTNDSYLLFLFPHKPKTIQLWHGVGPKGIPPIDYSICDARCVTSEYTKKRHIELWNAPPEKLYVTGFARMDILYHYLKVPKNALLEELKINSKKRIILYAPTFDIGLWPWNDPYTEFRKLCEFCKKNDLTLILRLHPLTKIKRKKLKKIIEEYENVYWIDASEEPDTMKLLAASDILITDWSSIYTDYFLTKRPIIYLEVNAKYFTEERGKPEIPPEFRAGEVARNNEEFCKALDIVLRVGNRFVKEQERLLKLIHGDVDGKARERVTEVIKKLLA